MRSYQYNWYCCYCGLFNEQVKQTFDLLMNCIHGPFNVLRKMRKIFLLVTLGCVWLLCQCLINIHVCCSCLSVNMHMHGAQCARSCLTQCKDSSHCTHIFAVLTPSLRKCGHKSNDFFISVNRIILQCFCKWQHDAVYFL